MRNIFLLYMPPNNLEAMTHYRDTIQQKVPLERIARHVSVDTASRLLDIFGQRPVAVWGSRDTATNRAKYSKMSEGDDLLIVEGATVRFIGKIALKTINSELSRELWDNIDSRKTTGWDLIYFIANPLEIDLPFSSACSLFEYEPNYQLRGFTIVSAERLAKFYRRYDDLYSVLMKLRAGKPIAEKEPELAEMGGPVDDGQLPDTEAMRDRPISDHVKMQWKLARLGRKAGEKIWVPPADQTRLRSTYNFVDFEPEFSAGIDLPRGYYENIDVIWKEEFRIDAAFEVENSTAIYSGLLRFADLNVVAPNTTYPMFVVAPAERKHQVREQVRRPAFGRLNLRDKVKFLSYEVVDEIEKFFAEANSGLSVKLIEGKAESLD